MNLIIEPLTALLDGQKSAVSIASLFNQQNPPDQHD